MVFPVIHPNLRLQQIQPNVEERIINKSQLQSSIMVSPHSTSINDLPMEVLEYALNFLHNYKDLMSCTLVSRKFHLSSVWLLDDYGVFAFKGMSLCEESYSDIPDEHLDFVLSLNNYEGIRQSTARFTKCTLAFCDWLNHNVTKSVTALELDSCLLQWGELADLLTRFDNLNSLSIAMNLRCYKYRPPIPEALDHLTYFMDGVEDIEWEDAQIKAINFVAVLHSMGKKTRSVLRKLKIDVMFPNGSSFLILLLTLLYKDKLALEEFSVKIAYEETKLLMYEKSCYYLNPQGGLVNIPGVADFYSPLKCSELLQISKNTLRKLSFSCLASFPYSGGWPTVAEPHEDVHHESSLRQRLSEGLFEDIFKEENSNKNETSWKFPNLQNLYIDVPIVTLSQYNSNKLLMFIDKLINYNQHVKTLTLKGLHLKEGLENVIQQSYVLPNVKCALGLKAVSFQAGNPTLFSEQIEDLTVDIMGDYCNGFEDLFKLDLDFKEKTTTKNQVIYKRLKYFSAANGSLYLTSYGLQKIIPLAPNLTELYLRDLSMPRNINPMERDNYISAPAHLTDADIQVILKTLNALQKLHLQCDLSLVTDMGLTGISKQACKEMGNGFSKHLCNGYMTGASFSSLKNLKYLVMEETGKYVTNITARFAFTNMFHLEYFMFDSRRINRKGKLHMYNTILSTSPSCLIANLITKVNGHPLELS